MDRQTFFAAVQREFAPQSYLQIGVRDGFGLSPSAARTIGVDPAFQITTELSGDIQLVRATSDEFFARPDPVAWFANGVVDLAFIDGLHIFEFALRDFIAIERVSSPASVVVFDGVLPQTAAQAARDRRTRTWAGDVYKITQVLSKYRPDLVVVPVDVNPSGLLLVVGLDPTNTVLADRYDEIVAEHANADPQTLPDDVMHRTSAADAEAVLAAPTWADLGAARAAGSRPASLSALSDCRGTATFVWTDVGDQTWRVKQRAARRAVAKKTAKTPPKRGTVWRIRKAIKRRL